jgi:beta-galactosidase
MNLPPDKLHLGAAYYPEHWPEDRWTEDIRLMKEAGLTVARMGEFAWSTFESTENEFEFDWLDLAIDQLAENGIVTVLGTPTAAPPAWLTQTYPNTLAVDENGRRYEHGRRVHYCVNSPEYHERTRSIVSKMAEHYGGNPKVIGWQIDNEFGTVCYCDTCRAAFQQYLEVRYESLDSLNEHWTTRYWSQSYSAWDQIPIPKSGHNPGLMLAFQQFVTHSYKKFQRLQVDILRANIPKQVWITHNFMGWFPTYDHYELNADLDIASWDWYVPTGHPVYTETGAAHDLVRGFKRRNFWLMETQPGNVNWASINNHVNKGECRAMAWHAVGHGADAVLYWQWRMALNGQEQYHGSLVDQSGQPRLFYEEVAQLGREFSKASDLLAGSEIKAKVAILNDYNSRWSLDWSRHHEDFNYVQHLLHYYKPFVKRNIPVDIISADDQLDGYRLVIAPAVVIMTPERVREISDFVARGGTLILTIRCGMQDEHNALLPMRQPGPLAEIAGVEVEEYFALDTPVDVKGNFFDGVSHIWAERLHILDESKSTLAVARYGKHNGWLDDQLAITVNPFKNGMVYTSGAYLDEAAQDAFLEQVIKVANISPLIKTPAGVEICQRITADGYQVGILINHTPSEQQFQVPFPIHDYLTEQRLEGEISLAAYDVIVFTRAE